MFNNPLSNLGYLVIAAAVAPGLYAYYAGVNDPYNTTAATTATISYGLSGLGPFLVLLGVMATGLEAIVHEVREGNRALHNPGGKVDDSLLNRFPADYRFGQLQDRVRGRA
jgi:hypothetical protein